jgi:hypothetical protein
VAETVGAGRSLSSAGGGVAVTAKKANRKNAGSGERGRARDRGRSPASLSVALVSPGLQPALARNPSALSGATHSPATPQYIYLCRGSLVPVSRAIYPSSAGESEGAGSRLPSKVSLLPRLISPSCSVLLAVNESTLSACRS